MFFYHRFTPAYLAISKAAREHRARLEALLQKADEEAIELQKAKDECDGVLEGAAVETHITPKKPSTSVAVSPEEGTPESTVRALTEDFEKARQDRGVQNQGIPKIATPLRNVMNELEHGTPPPPIPRDGWGNGNITSCETLPLTPTLQEPEYVDGMEDGYNCPTEAQPQKSRSNKQHAYVCKILRSTFVPNDIYSSVDSTTSSLCPRNLVTLVTKKVGNLRMHVMKAQHALKLYPGLYSSKLIGFIDAVLLEPAVALFIR